MTPEGHAQFEFQKMQLVGSVSSIANAMRECANVADQFAQMIGAFPYGPPFPGIVNGQFPMPPLPMPVPQETTKKRKSRGDDGEVKRRVKKPKDPNAPKRPASSYLLFQNDIRNELKAKHPGIRNNELLGMIAKLWGEMPPEQKDAYESRNRVAKDEWLSRKAIYESAKAADPNGLTHVTVPPVVVPTPTTSKAPEASPSEESSDEDDSSSDSSSEEEDEPAPPPKKKKDAPAVVAPGKVDDTPSKKEKKHKKSKAV